MSAWRSMAIKLCLMVVIFVKATVAATELFTATNTDFYTAGVVEFRPVVSAMSAAEMLQEHLQAYSEIISSAAAAATDIIVFPEATLNSALTMTYVPDPQENRILCNNSSIYSDFLEQLSCLAREHRKYLVINLIEKQNCTTTTQDPRPCAPSGLSTYNTNVVFDREGRLISRYRKVHIYTEPRNTTLQPEHAIFDTDFGVRFGHFICFDMLFYTPAEELVRKHGVQNIIFTSMFYSELPFLTAVQLQQSWAWANNVNLLAAGASYPAAGMTGSGIYAGQSGSLNAVMLATGSGERRLLVAKVPKNPNSIITTAEEKDNVVLNQAPKHQRELKLMKDYQMENYTTQLLDLSQQLQPIQQSLCDATGHFCCHFKVAAQAFDNTSINSNEYKYRLALFNGERRYEQLEWSSLQICAIIACTNDTQMSCGEIFKESANFANDFEFTELEIVANFTKTNQLLLMPNSLNSDLYPLSPMQAQWKLIDGGSFYTAHFSLNKSVNNLLTFGIYGNYYDRSAALPQTFAASSVIVLVAVLLSALMLR